MKIPQEYLAEKNYEGTRLVEVTDETVLKLKTKLKELQTEANPFLVKMEAITPILDPFYTKLRDLEEQKKKIQEEMSPVMEKYQAELQEVEKIDSKAKLIKDKIEPIVYKLAQPLLGEFEKATQLVEKGDKVYIEIIDELEEKVKAIRTTKANAIK